MFPKKKINKSITSTKSNIKKLNNGKSLSLIVINNHNLSNSNIKKKIRHKNSNKVNYIEKSLKKDINSSKENKFIKTTIYNLSLNRQNSQSSLYPLKNNIYDSQKTNYNNNDNKKHKKYYSSYYLSEVKTPKLFKLLNDQKKKKKNYLETYNNDSSKGSYYAHNYHKSKSSISLRPKKEKKENLTKGNIENILSDDYLNCSILKSTRNFKILRKLELERKADKHYNKTNTNKLNSRYDKNKCVIERRVYAGEKQKKNKIENNTDNKELPNLGICSYNKIIFNGIKSNSNKDTNLKNLNKPEKKDTKKSNNNFNLKIKKDINDKNSSSKLLIKSNTNNKVKVIKDSSKNLRGNNKIENTTNKNNIGSNDGKDIKFIFINKSDFVNESSQESTSHVGNSNSNKITINNTNHKKEKEKFISSFINGPEDIHYKFVELHKQRKIFYENLCNGLEEDGNSIENNKTKNINDFDINEYSEYFENYNENVPVI